MFKFLKWLPAVLPLLGVAAYSHPEMQWLQIGVDILKQANGILNANTEANGSSVSEKGSSYEGRVVKVYDGDTLHITDSNGRKHKIRMAYIDAPEMQQAFGSKSRDNLRHFAENHKVRVDVLDTDRYQREVARVKLGDTDLNLMQVEGGFAWHYKDYARKGQKKQDFAIYADAQKLAEQQRKGLWKSKNPQAPWLYRKAQRQQNSSDESGAKTWWQDWVKEIGDRF